MEPQETWKIVAVALLCLLIDQIAAFENETESFGSVNANNSSKSCDQSVNYDVCLAGTRMYKLLSYEVDSTQILSSCLVACNDSYSVSSEEEACEYGCLVGVASTMQRNQQLTQFGNEESSLIHRAMQQQMLSHWMFAMITGFDLFNDWYDSTEGDDSVDYSTYLMVEESDNELKISSYRIGNRPLIATTATADSGPLNPYVGSDDDYEPCYTRSTYSRLVVCLLLFSSAMFLIWLTCSTVTTAPKQSVQEEKENGDEKKALKKLLDNSPPSVHVPNKSTDDDDKMLLA